MNETRIVSLAGTEHWDKAALAEHAGEAVIFTATGWSKGVADSIAHWLADRKHKGRWAVVTDEPEGWLAVVVPPRTDAPCPHCLSWRIHNSPIRRLSREIRFTQPVRALRRSPHELADVGRWIGRQTHPPAAVLQHWPQMSWWGRAQVPRHEWIWREEWCPTCGDPKFVAGDGADVRAIVQHHHDHAGPWGGIFSETHTAGTAAAPNVVLNVTARGDGRGLPGARDRASGKGRTVQESAAGAVGECTERRAVTAPPPWARVIRGASREWMTAQGYRTLPHHDLQPFSEDQWRRRHAINAEGHAHYKVPEERPDDTTELDWVEGRDLVSGGTVWLPLDHVFYRPGRPRRHFVPDTNGCAAGTSPSDAVERGFRELAERDAWNAWWVGAESPPGLPLDIDPQAVAVARELAQHGRSIHLLDLTLFPDLPVVMAVSPLVEPLKDGPAEGGLDIIHGAGCAPTFAEAARRAVGEVVQCAMLGSPPAHRLAFHVNDPDALQGMRWNRETAPWHWPEGEHRPADPEKPTSWFYGYRDLAKQWGSPLVAVDISPGARELPVWKVVCPFLAHFWPRRAHPRQSVVRNDVACWL